MPVAGTRRRGVMAAFPCFEARTIPAPSSVSEAGPSRRIAIGEGRVQWISPATRASSGSPVRSSGNGPNREPCGTRPARTSGSRSSAASPRRVARDRARLRKARSTRPCGTTSLRCDPEATRSNRSSSRRGGEARDRASSAAAIQARVPGSIRNAARAPPFDSCRVARSARTASRCQALRVRSREAAREARRSLRAAMRAAIHAVSGGRKSMPSRPVSGRLRP